MLVFKLVNVNKVFGPLKALHNINLEIQAGEQVALVGPSGAGKSTLLSLLNGTAQPSAGEIQVLSQNLARLSPQALRELQYKIGKIYQDLHLIDNLRVIHNLNAGHLGRWPLWKALLSLVWPLEVETAYHTLEQVGIPEKLYEQTRLLSGGQQQRVALARVLIQNPAAILADEPTSNIDPERSREIMALFRDLSQKSGKTLVMSMHTIHFALDYFERIIGLREGRVLFDLPTEKVTPETLERLYKIDGAL